MKFQPKQFVKDARWIASYLFRFSLGTGLRSQEATDNGDETGGESDRRLYDQNGQGGGGADVQGRGGQGEQDRVCAGGYSGGGEQVIREEDQDRADFQGRGGLAEHDGVRKGGGEGLGENDGGLTEVDCSKCPTSLARPKQTVSFPDTAIIQLLSVVGTGDHRH